MVEFYATTEGGEDLTNSEKLKQRIEDSGLKQSYIANKLGLSSYGFARKRDNISEFLPSEINALCDLLDIQSVEERFEIFFAS